MKKVISLFLILTLVVSVVACGGKTETPAETPEPAETPVVEEAEPADNEAAKPAADTGKPLEGKRIAVAHISMYDEWCTGVYDELMAQMDDYGIAEVNVQDANFSIETQQKNVEDFVSQGYDAILIDVTDSEGLKPALDKAHEAGIPVVAFDSGTDWEHLISHIAWDHAETGRLTAQWVANYAKEKLNGKVKIGLITFTTLPHTKARSDAFVEELEKELGAENIEYVFTQDFDQSRESATNLVTNNIAKPMDVIWAPVDNGAFGAKIALENAGIEGTIVISAGGWGKETFTTINDNDPYYKAAVGVPPSGIVQYCYDTLADYFSGKTDIPATQNIELVVMDGTNIADYMKYVKAE
ncbi:sugar ABC transporter substrate-binding protein [bacterium 1XD21-13]|nr:sugar ABC transporter substrate-binding protein [bacterium 1XD21-13]